MAKRVKCEYTIKRTDYLLVADGDVLSTKAQLQRELHSLLDVGEDEGGTTEVLSYTRDGVEVE